MGIGMMGSVETDVCRRWEESMRCLSDDDDDGDDDGDDVGEDEDGGGSDTNSINLDFLNS